MFADYHFLALIVFVVLTVLRQIYYFQHQSEQKKIHSGDTIRREDALGSRLISGLYIIIWFGATYELYTNEFMWMWYIAGLLLMITGVTLRVKALRDLGKNYDHEITIWTNHQLITRGIYAWIRHPLYLALMVELLGMALVGREFLILTAWLLFVIVIIRRISLEDRVLLSLGEFTKEYQKAVPALNIFVWLSQNRSKFLMPSLFLLVTLPGP